MSSYDRRDGGRGRRRSTRRALPDAAGVVERDGVARSTGSATGTASPRSCSCRPGRSCTRGIWKAQVPLPRPALPRASRSTAGATALRTARPTPRPTPTHEFAADTVAVLDATGTEPAVAGRRCRCGGCRALLLAAEHPERVRGLVAIGAASAILRPRRRDRAAFSSTSRARHLRGLGEVQPPLLAARTTATSSSSSSAEMLHRAALDQADRGLRRLGARDDAGDAGRDTTVGDSAAPTRGRVEALLRAVALPGAGASTATDDAIARSRVGERAGRADRRRRSSLLEGAGHGPPARDPVRVNLLMREFVDRVAGAAGRDAGRAAARAPQRALYVSSPIGLGHARRDLAIADELRRLRARPRDRLARPAPGHDACCEARGERVHPASAELASECGPHRARGRRARPARVPGAPADGRDPRAPTSWCSTTSCARSTTTCGSATRPGRSTTSCTRTRS